MEKIKNSKTSDRDYKVSLWNDRAMFAITLALGAMLISVIRDTADYVAQRDVSFLTFIGDETITCTHCILIVVIMMLHKQFRRLIVRDCGIKIQPVYHRTAIKLSLAIAGCAMAWWYTPELTHTVVNLSLIVLMLCFYKMRKLSKRS